MAPPVWTWGDPSEEMVRTVPLWWNAVPIPVRPDGKLVDKPTQAWLMKQGCEGDLVYALEARHDGQRQATVLYVGESTQGETRLSESLARFIDSEYGALYSDCSDLVVRWAKVNRDLRKDVEMALIVAHAPPFNSQGIRKRFEREQITVFNAGAKGCLLGVVDSRYFTGKEPWPKRPPDP